LVGPTCSKLDIVDKLFHDGSSLNAQPTISPIAPVEERGGGTGFTERTGEVGYLLNVSF
jgi:hypothetical protein